MLKFSKHKKYFIIIPLLSTLIFQNISFAQESIQLFPLKQLMNQYIEEQKMKFNVTNTNKEKEEKQEYILEYLGEFEITAYDLSVQSCSKEIGHPAYGITKSGINISGLKWYEAMTIAVDPKVISLGSKVKIEFDEDDWRSQYNGIYTANDIGGAIKKNRIDLFVGDFNSNKVSEEAIKFGRVKGVKVWLVIENDLIINYKNEVIDIAN